MRVLVFATLFLLAVPALAEEPALAPAKLDRSHPDYVRCETITAIGNRAKRERVCKTNAEWKRLAENARGNARDVQERGTTLSNPGN